MATNDYKQLLEQIKEQVDELGATVYSALERSPSGTAQEYLLEEMNQDMGEMFKRTQRLLSYYHQEKES